MHFFYLQIDHKSSVHKFFMSLKAALSCIEYQASKGRTISSEIHSQFSFVIYPVKIQQQNVNAVWLGFSNSGNTEVKGIC